MYNFSGASFVYYYVCRCLVIIIKAVRVLKVVSMSWRRVAGVSLEGRGKGARDGDKVGR